MADAFHYLVTPSGREDRPAPSRPRPAHRRAGERDRRSARESWPAGDTRILRPVDDSPSYEIFHDVLAQPLLDWQARFQAARLPAPRRRPSGWWPPPRRRSSSRWSRTSWRPGGSREAELMTVDARFALRGDVPVEPRRRDRGPRRFQPGGARRWCRADPAAAPRPHIDQLRAAGAAVIAYDIEFRECTPRGRRPSGIAIDRAGPQLVLAATLIDSEGQGQILGGPGAELSATWLCRVATSRRRRLSSSRRARGLSGAAVQRRAPG